MSERPRLGFYRRLAPALKREYDRSDALRTLPLAPHRDLGAATNRLVEALGSGEPARVRRAAQELVERLCRALDRPGRRKPSPAPRVKVLRTRPRFASGEFHGLYTVREGEEAEIRVWMLTAAHRQVVKPRTFLRTLLHEVCHHLDMTRLDLPSSLHTPGFHARESSLVRALERSGGVVPGGRGNATAPAARPAGIVPVEEKIAAAKAGGGTGPPPAPKARPTRREPLPAPSPRRRSPAGRQLELF